MPAQLLIDECLGKPIISPLTQLIAMGKGEKPQLKHILDFTASGTHDEVWIPQIARGGWTIITSDGGRSPVGHKGEKLPDLCARYGITHIVLSSAVHHRPAFEKVLTILSVWYQLLEISTDANMKGSRYHLEPLPLRPNGIIMRGHGRLMPKPISPELLALRDEYLQNLDSDLDKL